MNGAKKEREGKKHAQESTRLFSLPVNEDGICGVIKSNFLIDLYPSES